MNQHTITLVKRKGFYIKPSHDMMSAEQAERSQVLVNKIQLELAQNGFVMNKLLHDTLSQCHESELSSLYEDLVVGLHWIIGGTGYQPIYYSFPEGVKNMSQEEFVINAIIYYMTNGAWKPEDASQIQRKTGVEPGKFKTLRLLDKSEFDSIFTDIIYSGNSISKTDKQIIDWFLDNTTASFNLDKIKFNETKAYIGTRLINTANGNPLPIKSATTLLRTYCSYCGGDEGLKTPTNFKRPNPKQRESLRATLNQCYDLEESFKSYREPWLRLLWYLKTTSKINQTKFPELHKYSRLLREQPKLLKTFNARIEEAIATKDEDYTFGLLRTRKGVFMRRMDHLVRVFGIKALHEFLALKPSFSHLISLYNFFAQRGTGASRSGVLASSDGNTMVQYKQSEELPEGLVEEILELLMNELKKIPKKLGATYIDKSLYQRPLASNNRGSNFNLTGVTIGTIELLPKGQVVRAYVHWTGRSDIDLSGMIIAPDSNRPVVKVGWNGKANFEDSVVYSGDNTGTSSKNAEYLDIDIDKLQSKNVEWVIVDANIFSYRGGGSPSTYANPNWTVKAGYMMRQSPNSREIFQPDTIANCINIESDAKVSYLMAINIPKRCIVYLDIAIKQSNITSNEDALKICDFLDSKISVPEEGISWKHIRQGHVLNLLSKQVIEDVNEAEHVFDENTTWETISKYIE